MKIVHTVQLASGYEIWQLDQMTGCVSKYKHVLEKVQKQDASSYNSEAMWFSEGLQIAYFYIKSELAQWVL